MPVNWDAIALYGRLISQPVQIRRGKTSVKIYVCFIFQGSIQYMHDPEISHNCTFRLTSTNTIYIYVHCTKQLNMYLLEYLRHDEFRICFHWNFSIQKGVLQNFGAHPVLRPEYFPRKGQTIHIFWNNSAGKRFKFHHESASNRYPPSCPTSR